MDYTQQLENLVGKIVRVTMNKGYSKSSICGTLMKGLGTYYISKPDSCIDFRVISVMTIASNNIYI